MVSNEFSLEKHYSYSIFFISCKEYYFFKQNSFHSVESEKGDNSHKPLDGSGIPAISDKGEMRESHLDNLLVKMTRVLLFKRSVGWRIGKGKRGGGLKLCII